ncbi:unnamed protein product [Ostreobium quekettii]|uniref:Uncharacterized protein n=1 Tax=Ostreobium quekettii TaxID=121088 RepID=A0A8S1J9N1_9CHLO|nr:unnamed protein product [Ostreobium quekettii]
MSTVHYAMACKTKLLIETCLRVCANFAQTGSCAEHCAGSSGAMELCLTGALMCCGTSWLVRLCPYSGRVQNRFETFRGAGRSAPIAGSHMLPVPELDPYCLEPSDVSSFPLAGK